MPNKWGFKNKWELRREDPRYCPTEQDTYEINTLYGIPVTLPRISFLSEPLEE